MRFVSQLHPWCCFCFSWRILLVRWMWVSVSHPPAGGTLETCVGETCRLCFTAPWSSGAAPRGGQPVGFTVRRNLQNFTLLLTPKKNSGTIAVFFSLQVASRFRDIFSSQWKPSFRTPKKEQFHFLVLSFCSFHEMILHYEHFKCFRVLGRVSCKQRAICSRYLLVKLEKAGNNLSLYFFFFLRF